MWGKKKRAKERPSECHDARRHQGRCDECTHVHICELPEAEAGRLKAKEQEAAQAREDYFRAQRRLESLEQQEQEEP